MQRGEERVQWMPGVAGIRHLEVGNPATLIRIRPARVWHEPQRAPVVGDGEFLVVGGAWALGTQQLASCCVTAGDGNGAEISVRAGHAQGGNTEPDSGHHCVDDRLRRGRHTALSVQGGNGEVQLAKGSDPRLTGDVAHELSSFVAIDLHRMNATITYHRQASDAGGHE